MNTLEPEFLLEINTNLNKIIKELYHNQYELRAFAGSGEQTENMRLAANSLGRSIAAVGSAVNWLKKNEEN